MTDTSNKAKSQCQKLLKYLETHKEGITPAEAWNLYGIYRLGARIWDLRAKNYNIRTIDEIKKNDEGHTVRFARYILEG